MGYSDEELRAFTQIAYMELDEKYKKLCKDGETVVPLTELLSPKEKKRLEDLGIDESEYSDWSISGIQDANDNTGFYACVIQTSPGNAAVSFRGSEKASSLDNLLLDWGLADLGLLNSICTTQHREVDRFLQDKEMNELLNGYDNITMTGHSLGGNLAEYATIQSYKYGLDDNISQCVSLDGPGFSNEFIMTHSKGIAKMRKKMTHYQWSPVGNLLLQIPGIKVETLAVKEQKEYDVKYEFTRHDTECLLYEGDSFKRGNQSIASFALGVLSIDIDMKIIDLPRMLLDIGMGAIEETKLYDYVVKILNEIQDKAQGINGRGHDLAEKNIKINTEQLRSYALRLQNINKKMLRLDGRMKGLYFQIKIPELWNLIQVDAMSGYSWRINSCVKYLERVAEEFESAERRIQS